MRIIALSIFTFFSSYTYAQQTSEPADNSDFSNRKVISRPRPEYWVMDTGTITLKIRINPEGNVIKADVDSTKCTSYNESLISNSIEAALKTKYSKIEKDSFYIGTITYKFSYE